MSKDTPKSTDCCPPFDPSTWDKKEFEWKDKLFIKDSVRSFLYIPLNFGGVLKRMNEKIKKSQAELPNKDWLLLSRDVSPFKSEQLYAVSKEVEDAENVKLSGKFISKVYEGPYKEAKNWYKDMMEYVQSKGKEAKKVYFYYTTCPKCAKEYGKNYVVAIAEV